MFLVVASNKDVLDSFLVQQFLVYSLVFQGYGVSFVAVWSQVPASGKVLPCSFLWFPVSLLLSFGGGDDVCVCSVVV